MAEERHFLTAEGKAKLERELEHLRTVRRPQVAKHLRESIEDGDLTENAGYEESKREQAFVEGRIAEIDRILRTATLLEVDPSKHGDRVTLGSRVTVVEAGSDTEETYLIVGPAEADPADGRISNVSPLGQALMGHGAGDEVEADTPIGVLTFAIRAVG
jgi:transcription elongation factor GreA